MSAYLDDYAAVGVIVLVGVGLAAAMLGVNRLMRPQVTSREKQTTYESGVDPVGDDWAQTQIRYYVFAFLYVIFAVESVFLFPWATVFVWFGWQSLVEMGVFVAVLAIALLYAWRRKVLSWV